MLSALKRKLGLSIQVDSIEESTNQGVDFQDSPLDCHCPHCKASIVSYVECRNSCITYTLAFIIFLLLGWISIIVLPIIWSILQDSVHICPSCMNLIHRHRRISLPSIKQDIVTIRFGSCAIVLSRKYVYMLGILILAISAVFLLRIYMLNINHGGITEGPSIDTNWTEFFADCGQKGQFRNHMHAETLFKTYYEGKTVDWHGKLLKIQQSLWGSTILLIRMNPSQFNNLKQPDLALIVHPNIIEEITSLEEGDSVRFLSTLITLGKSSYPHILYLWELKN